MNKKTNEPKNRNRDDSTQIMQTKPRRALQTKEVSDTKTMKKVSGGAQTKANSFCICIAHK